MKIKEFNKPHKGFRRGELNRNGLSAKRRGLKIEFPPC